MPTKQEQLLLKESILMWFHAVKIEIVVPDLACLRDCCPTSPALALTLSFVHNPTSDGLEHPFQEVRASGWSMKYRRRVNFDQSRHARLPERSHVVVPPVQLCRSRVRSMAIMQGLVCVLDYSAFHHTRMDTIIPTPSGSTDRARNDALPSRMPRACALGRRKLPFETVGRSSID